MKLVLIGCGAVGTAILELITLDPALLHFNINCIEIIEPRAIKPIFKKYIINKCPWPIVWHRHLVTKASIKSIFAKYITPQDIVIDVSVNTGTLDIMKYMLRHNIHYVNTSFETWPADNSILFHDDLKKQLGLTTYNLHCKLAQIMAKGKHGDATMVVEHGMNPGLISSFTKLAIKNLAGRELKTREDYARACYQMGVKIIQCSEKDTQISKPNKRRKKNEFVSTWAPMGFIEEGLELAQIGRGSHEVLAAEVMIPKCGERNQFILPVRGINLMMKSAVPSGGIMGYVIPHGEGETLSRYLTYNITNKNIYRPTTHYVYQHNNEAIESVNYLKSKKFRIPAANLRVIYGCDIASGYDEVGALVILSRDDKTLSYWAGTILSITQTRQLGFEISGPTSVQVAISVLAAVNHIARHPHLSVLYPEQLDSDWVLDYCKKYLGTIYADFIDYHPVNLAYTAAII